jgi:hypothetical protein
MGRATPTRCLPLRKPQTRTSLQVPLDVSHPVHVAPVGLAAPAAQFKSARYSRGAAGQPRDKPKGPARWHHHVFTE